MPNEKNGFRFSYSLTQKADKDEAEILLYNEIVQYKWYKDDPEITAADFDKLLKEAKNSGATKLRLRVNCPGGSVWQAVAMRTMLINSDFEEVNVDIEGLCASAATFFVCVPGAHVRIAQGSEFMIHNPRAWCGGTADDFQNTATRLYTMQDEQHEMYAARTGESKEQIKAWMDAETWFTAKDAVAHGFADEMIATMDAAACVTPEDMGLMQEMYCAIPEQIATRKAQEGTESVSIGDTQVASAKPTEHNNTHKEGNVKMDIHEMTPEQLMAENPTLYQSVFSSGATAERERMQEIDSLTDEGFEEMAQEAKNNGTSSADFLKQVVKARNEKKSNFLNNRKAETAPAQSVEGGSAADNDGVTEEDDMKAHAKEMAEIAKSINHGDNGMY